MRVICFSTLSPFQEKSSNIFVHMINQSNFWLSLDDLLRIVSYLYLASSIPIIYTSVDRIFELISAPNRLPPPTFQRCSGRQLYRYCGYLTKADNLSLQQET
jgi:hypothetical protein